MHTKSQYTTGPLRTMVKERKVNVDAEGILKAINDFTKEV